MSSNIEVNRVCERCRNDFTARTTVTKYCSHKCASQAYKARIKGAKIETSNKEVVQTKVAPIVELQAKEFLSAADACRLLGISRQTLWRAIKNKQLFAARIGWRIVISRAEIARITEGKIL